MTPGAHPEGPPDPSSAESPAQPLEVDPAATASWSLDTLRAIVTGREPSDFREEWRNISRLGWIAPGILHALKLILGLVILWWGARRLHVDPFWAYVSMIVVGSETTGSMTVFVTRIFNTLVGCAFGLAILLAFPPSIWSLCLALTLVVLVCSAFLGPPARWKIAPITTVIVMGSAVVERSRSLGIDNGIRRFVAVLAGSALGLLISLAFAQLEKWPRRSDDARV